MTNSDNTNLIAFSAYICGASALCAIAATKAALTALITGEFPDPVGLILPEGEVPYFPLAMESLSEFYAMAGIVKNADIMQEIGNYNNDKDSIANGTTIIATTHPAPPESGLKILAGDGIAENNMPILDEVSERLLYTICQEICKQYALPTDLVVTISIIK